MPVPGLLAAAGIAGQAGAGIAQIIGGNKIARDAQKNIDAYQRQDLSQNLADGLQLRTEAQEFQSETSDRTLANALDVLKQGGSFGNATALINQKLQSDQNITASIQKQRDRLDNLKLQESQNIRSLQENRENADLAGLGSQLQYGNQQKAQGIGTIGGAFGNLTKAASGGLF